MSHVWYKQNPFKHWLKVMFKGGRRARARTGDPLIKSQLLYQLSYASIKKKAQNVRCSVGQRNKKAYDSSFDSTAAVNLW